MVSVLQVKVFVLRAKEARQKAMVSTVRGRQAAGKGMVARDEGSDRMLKLSDRMLKTKEANDESCLRVYCV